jgi:hypothetical protein
MPGAQERSDQLAEPNAGSRAGTAPDLPQFAERPERGSLADLRRRLERLPAGHPSSPYSDDFTRKSPVVRLKDLELPLQGGERSAEPTATHDGTAARNAAPSRQGSSARDDSVTPESPAAREGSAARESPAARESSAPREGSALRERSAAREGSATREGSAAEEGAAARQDSASVTGATNGVAATHEGDSATRESELASAARPSPGPGAPGRNGLSGRIPGADPVSTGRWADWAGHSPAADGNGGAGPGRAGNGRTAAPDTAPDRDATREFQNGPAQQATASARCGGGARPAF